MKIFLILLIYFFPFEKFCNDRVTNIIRVKKNPQNKKPKRMPKLEQKQIPEIQYEFVEDYKELLC